MTNEAAERLRHAFDLHGVDDWSPGPWEELNRALAEERSRVIAEIRERVGPVPIVSWQSLKYVEVLDALTRFMQALDEVEQPDTEATE